MKKRNVYTPEFKKQIFAERAAGATPAKIAAKHGLKVSLVWNWMTQARKAGVKFKVATPKTKTGRARARATARASDAERIVTELLASLRPGLIEAVSKLVDLGVERKIASTRQCVLDALKEAA